MLLDNGYSLSSMDTVRGYRVSVQVRDCLDYYAIGNGQHHDMVPSLDGERNQLTLVLLASDLNLV